MPKPLCPKCQEPMERKGDVDGMSGHVCIVVFQCPACKNIEMGDWTGAVLIRQWG